MLKAHYLKSNRKIPTSDYHKSNIVYSGCHTAQYDKSILIKNHNTAEHPSWDRLTINEQINDLCKLSGPVPAYASMI